MSYFPGFSFISMPKTALVEKCDKTGPNWLGNGQKRGEKCQCLFYTVAKMRFRPRIAEFKKWQSAPVWVRKRDEMCYRIN